ncbi:MAG: HAD family hydrolase [Pseudomonadota bacterium]
MPGRVTYILFFCPALGDYGIVCGIQEVTVYNDGAVLKPVGGKKGVHVKSHDKERVLDAVIFDLDGTLIDSIDIYFTILDVTFEKLKLPPVEKSLIIKAAKDGDFDWDLILPGNDGEAKKTMIRRARQIIYEIYPEMFCKGLTLIPGAASVLNRLSRSNLKIAIVTSTPAEGMVHKFYPLKNADVDQLLEVIITGDDVENKKPCADPLIECAKRLGVHPNRSVYVGDMGADIRAGKAAGMRTVGVLTGFDDHVALKQESPDAIIPSIVNLPETIASWHSGTGIDILIS